MKFPRPSVALIVCLSVISASGTFPYGYKFASHVFNDNSTWQILLALICAISSTFLNIVLETYSLLKIEFNRLTGRLIVYAFMSFLGSMPRGFICYFGFSHIMPLPLNLAVCSIVILVNTAVGYTSLRLFFQGIKEFMPKENRAKHKVEFSWIKFFHILGFIIGILVSLVGFLAASSGLNDIFMRQGLPQLVNYHLGYILGLIAWMPYAALYANGTHTVLADIYTSLIAYKKNISDITIVNVIVSITCIFSGTALAEITYEFMTSDQNSIAILKTGTIHEIIVFFIVPFSLISSAAVNYFSIIKLYKLRKKLLPPEQKEMVNENKDPQKLKVS